MTASDFCLLLAINVTMVNSEDFIKRLEKLFQYYGLSAAAFADTINVQRSSISHLLSGRNKPSLEFVLKVVKTFPEVNLYWLLNGKGTFPSEAQQSESPTPTKPLKSDENSQSNKAEKQIDKIVIFYSDGSFKSYAANKF